MTHALSILVLCLGIVLAAAQDKAPRLGSSNGLASVKFALDDRPTRGFEGTGHTEVMYYVGNGSVGMYRSIYNWATQGGHTPDTNAGEKAAECAKLLRSLQQPKGLPKSPTRILTAWCADGGKAIERRFPIDQVPPEVHRMLSIMGCGEEGMKRLAFLQKSVGSTTNGTLRVR